MNPSSDDPFRPDLSPGEPADVIPDSWGEEDGGEAWQETSRMLRQAFSAELHLVPVSRLPLVPPRPVPLWSRSSVWALGMAAALVCAAVFAVRGIREPDEAGLARVSPSPRLEEPRSFRIDLAPAPDPGPGERGGRSPRVPLDFPERPDPVAGMVLAPRLEMPGMQAWDGSWDAPRGDGSGWEPGERLVAGFPVRVGDRGYREAVAGLREGRMPPAEAVQVPEFVNAFDYRLERIGETVVAGEVTVAGAIAPCPWEPDHWLLAVASRRSREGATPEVRVAVSFHPATVSAYRLLGGEEVAESSPVSAPDVAATDGRQVVAFYEVIPGKLDRRVPWSLPRESVARVDLWSERLAATLGHLEIGPPEMGFAEAEDEFRFAGSVAGLALVLRGEISDATLVAELLAGAETAAAGHPERLELVRLIRQAGSWGG